MLSWESPSANINLFSCTGVRGCWDSYVALYCFTQSALFSEASNHIDLTVNIM